MMRACVVGWLGRDPDVKRVQDATVMELAVRIALGRGKGYQWVRLHLWSKYLQSRAADLRKGDRLIAWGVMTLRAYDNNGQPQATADMRCDDLSPLTDGAQ